MSVSQASHGARIAFDSTELCYNFGPEHPLQPARVEALLDLLTKSGLWKPDEPQTRLAVRTATLDELKLAHTADYIEAVQRLSTPATDATDQERARLALRYGFDGGDTPVVPDMHEVCATIAGGTLVAMSAVMELPEGGSFAENERPLHVFHPSGGLHHAWAERASGFCIYNDAAVAIAHVLRATEAKVLYIDFDAHHGDGVQRAFYDESRVMTISLHETGRYLFPGTGDVVETGNGGARGYAVNVPLEPFTEDDSYIEVMNALLTPLITSFAPDVLITQHGCDTHAYDPLTHLSLTTRGILAQIKAAHELAHTYCGGRWVALGGGGYDLYRVVPRAWSLVWTEMSEQAVPEALPSSWIERWLPAWQAGQEHEETAQMLMGKASGATGFPTTFLDRAADFPPQPRRWSISTTNRHTAALVRHLVVPPPVRQAFPSPRHRSPLAGLFDLLHLNRDATTAPSRTRTLQTERGPILMRDFSPPSLIERLRPDSGLKTFARLPEREHQLLLTIAKNPDCALTVAHTTTGEIVGEVTIAPADEWWEGIENLYEVAIEVSASWRGLGIARNMLSFALELDALEDMILFAIGLSWHWDTEGLGISVYRYREMLAHLFGTLGFTEYPTTEPNVSMEPFNVLMARIGKRVDQRVANQFLSRLLSSPNLAIL
jgi:acetoin utilization deacetylase AcuC-like enzyme/GNAT superfamily N-acetyltransferase